MENELDDRRLATFDAFKARGGEVNLPANAGGNLGQFFSPTERIYGAQRVAVHRDEEKVLGKLRTLAAAAGSNWYYRFPVRRKIKDEHTGKEGWAQDFIEGPSIVLANDLARVYGNIDIDVRLFDVGENWVIYARLTDLETGFALTRPFQQRKSQQTMKGDNQRSLDIALQIGVSKAIRNVVVNALQTFADFAFDEARNAMVDKVGRNLEDYRTRVLQRLDELKIEPARVERVIGRASAVWLAPDIAKIIAMLKAIADGMATVDETFPAVTKHDPETGEVKSETPTHEHAEHPVRGAKAEVESSSTSPPASDSARTGGATPPTGASPAAQYVSDAEFWIAALRVADAGAERWKAEKQLRNKSRVTREEQERLATLLEAKIGEISKDIDARLTSIARLGSAAFERAWAHLAPEEQKLFQAARVRRYQPMAEDADRASKGSQ